MKNEIRSFCLFVRNDSRSESIADSIRELNDCSGKPLQESIDGDLVIAIGGDGTFIDSVTSTNFSKNKIYAGIHTGTLGFMQNLSENEIFTLIKYIQYEKEIKTRKVLVSKVVVNLNNDKTLEFKSLNEVLVVGKNYSKISFSEYVNGELLQNVTGNGIIIATNTGDTAYSMNSGGAIDFSNHFQLVCTLETPIKNAAYERFITNPIICSKVLIIPKISSNISVIIDGITREIIPEEIKDIAVSIDGSDYINKLELESFSKVNIIRNKILGYEV